MGKVKVIPVVVKGKQGYDIKVTDENATVQDYIEALDEFIEREKCFRSRNEGIETCEGCNLCCQERIPVTNVDVLNLGVGELEYNIKNVFHVYVEDRVVDITMGLDEAGRCRFLDPKKGTCRNYRNRPLVCHTFICCPSSHTAKQLREEIVNAGEDELVRTWFGIKGNNGLPPIHEGISPQPDIRDYPKTNFCGATDYSSVRLKDICSAKLWKKLME